MLLTLSHSEPGCMQNVDLSLIMSAFAPALNIQLYSPFQVEKINNRKISMHTHIHTLSISQ